jgi:hypothetical protein
VGKPTVIGTSGCTNIAVRGASLTLPSRWLLGSVSDDPYEVRTKVVVGKEQGGLKYVATELHSLRGQGIDGGGYVVKEGECTRGVNEAGLAFTWAFAQELDPPTVVHGLRSDQFSRLLLTKCMSVDDALRATESAPRDFSAVSFFTDSHGELAQVEIGRRAFTITKRFSADDHGVAVNVNCYQDMKEYQDPRGSMDLSSAPNASRFTAAMTRLAQIQSNAELGDVAGVLADHQNIESAPAREPWIWPGQGFSICNHGSTFGTVSAEIIDPISKTLWYCYGWPCGGMPTRKDQVHQERSWGRFLPFCVDCLPVGCYTTLLGDLTALAVRHLGSGEGSLISRPQAARTTEGTVAFAEPN